jgi:hypothetical protein
MFSPKPSDQLSRLKACIPLYIPWMVAEASQSSPLTSYTIAWLGSFMIFYFTLAAPARGISNVLPVSQQLMRPIILIQIVFAGFMCVTSIFYFLDHLGYEYLTDINSRNFMVNAKTLQIATCQRYGVLGHASLCTGIILTMKPQLQQRYSFRKDPTELLMPACVIGLLLGDLTNRIPALVQFLLMLNSMAQFTAAVILVKGLHEKRVFMITFGGVVFLFNLISSSLSGYKEGVIVNLLLFVFLLFPHYKKVILLLTLPLAGLALYILPTLAGTIRTQSWLGGDTARDATAEAYLMLMSDDALNQINTTNWEFLTKRFSEIGMFTTYISAVPENHNYYGFEILRNSLQALVPRAFWEDKPNTEAVSMKRVYDAGVINRLSPASAKTRPIVDGYLSGGTFGVFLSMFVYGLLCQSLCNKAERDFGGYNIGCVIVFNGIFQQLWRGNNFEFIINNIFYGYLLMALIFFCLTQLRILVPTKSNH